MPYITKEDRELHEKVLEEYSHQLISSLEEEINPISEVDVSHFFLRVINLFFMNVYDLDSSSYWQYNELGGAITRCSMEWERRNGLPPLSIPSLYHISDYIYLEQIKEEELHGFSNYAQNINLINIITSLATEIKNMPFEKKSGHINYFLYSILSETFKESNWKWSKELKRESSLALLASLDQFYYNTYVAPYEDRKILENGDI